MKDVEVDMKHRTIGYVKKIDGILAGETEVDSWEDLMQDHLIQIGFFQHERLIHLMVTLTFAFLAVGTILVEIAIKFAPLLIIAFLMIVLLVPYIKHYFLLENKTQRMYEQYDKMLLKVKEERKNKEEQ